MPEEHTHAEYFDDVLRQFLILQCNHKALAFLIFNDLVSHMNFDSPLIKHLFTTYHHYNITVFVATQYLNREIPPVIHNCAENFIVFKQIQENSIQALQSACMNKFKNASECAKFIDLHCLNISDHKYILVQPMEESKNKYVVGKAPGQLPNVQLEF